MADTIKLTGKIFIDGKITVNTGLHIGGNKSSTEIGGVDNDIVKTGNGIPLIPGSSLKGKMRSLLAKVDGITDIRNDKPVVKKIFGDPSSKEDRFVTRLLVRDSVLNIESFDKSFGAKGNRNLDFDYSEIKTENVIKRSTGGAEHPRQMERVPANAIFDLNMVLNIYENDDKFEFLQKIKLSIDLLNMDYLGGSGSRGYGAVNVEIDEIRGNSISEDGIIGMPDLDKIKCVFNL